MEVLSFQFWGVTRHLKRNHDMTTQDIDRIREKIRARVFIRESNGHSSSPPGEQSSAPESTARTSDDATNSLYVSISSLISFLLLPDFMIFIP